MSPREESSSGGRGLSGLGRSCSDNRGRRSSGGHDLRGGRRGHYGDRRGLDDDWCRWDRNRGGHCDGGRWGDLGGDAERSWNGDRGRDAERGWNGDRGRNDDVAGSGNALPVLSASSGSVIRRLVGLGFLTITELFGISFIQTSFLFSHLFFPSLSFFPFPYLPSSASFSSFVSPRPSGSGGSRGSTRLIVSDYHRRRRWRGDHRPHRNDRDNRDTRDTRDNRDTRDTRDTSHHQAVSGSRLILYLRSALKSHSGFSFDLDLGLDLWGD